MGEPVGEEYQRAIDQCKKRLRGLIDEKNCPNLIRRIARHSAGADDFQTEFGMMRFPVEGSHGLVNDDLFSAIKVLRPIKEQFPILSYRDFYQLAVVVAVEVTGVPAIPFHRGSRQYQRAVNQCKEELRRFIAEKNCAPLMLRNAWHVAGTGNNDLHAARRRLRRIRRSFPILSDGDFYQLAGVVAFEVTGGPEIHFHPGSENLARRVEELEESNKEKAEEILTLRALLRRNGVDFQNLVRRVRMLEESNNEKDVEILTLKVSLARI
ncbi:probable L-ascorbate peroxidase 4, peroxisomal [Elaeis guineensis]|uniref:probable L-ascorbate peroxidase 4, peroxisomal n=1 Tax=Elaeis guineensis var. tenera TaxID=51953 RepID=UPI003C6DAA4B